MKLEKDKKYFENRQLYIFILAWLLYILTMCCAPHLLDKILLFLPFCWLFPCFTLVLQCHIFLTIFPVHMWVSSLLDPVLNLLGEGDWLSYFNQCLA